MSEGKLFNIGSTRTVLLLSLLLVVSFTVLLVTLLREPEPPGGPEKTRESRSPQMVRGKIQLPKPIEVSGPAAPPAKPSSPAPATQKVITEAATTSQATGKEAAGAKAEEPLKPMKKIHAAATKPALPQEKPTPALEKPMPSKTASVEGKERAAPVSVSVRKYTVQVGAFTRQSSAERLASRLRKSGFEAHVRPVTTRSGKTYYRVQVGTFSDILEAKKMEAKLQARKDITSTLVKRIQ